jgi:hypothetical protein
MVAELFQDALRVDSSVQIRIQVPAIVFREDSPLIVMSIVGHTTLDAPCPGFPDMLRP